jgi:menaquinol-cytochrome c reductase cytochrome b/c subunit
MAHKHSDYKFVGDSKVSATRKPNIPRPYSEFPGKTEPFFPNFLLKEWMVAVVVLIAFMTLVISHPAPLEPTPANPNDSSYIPLPDWYFLFMYQLLKYFPGELEIIGTIVIPGLAGLGLLLAPWLDRGPERRPGKRPIATGLMLFAVFAMVFLTYQSIVEHEKQLEAKGLNNEHQENDGGDQAGAGDKTDDAKEFDPAQVFASNCSACHGKELEGGPAAPSLIGLTYKPEEIAEIMTKGKGGMPANMFTGSQEEKLALANWILEHK